MNYADDAGAVGGNDKATSKSPPPLQITLQKSNDDTTTLALSQILTFDRYQMNPIEDRAPKIRNTVGWTGQFNWKQSTMITSITRMLLLSVLLVVMTMSKQHHLQMTTCVTERATYHNNDTNNNTTTAATTKVEVHWMKWIDNNKYSRLFLSLFPLLFRK
jgi:hypothetical protein